MHQQKLEDALHEAQKPLARHRDDEDLDRMLREQEREGDPMAAMLRRKKDRGTKTQGVFILFMTLFYFTRSILLRSFLFLLPFVFLFICMFVLIFCRETSI